MSNHITITITTGNAAFEVSEAEEVARILRGLADRIERNNYLPDDGNRLLDSNGNKVGTVKVEPC